MKLLKLLPILLLGISALGFTTQKTPSWQTLFNGKDLKEWDTYLAPDYDDSGKPLTGIPIGLNNDPKKVFTVIKQGEENIIRISGESWGAISTKKEYENYHLQLQFKWGNLKWGQKKNSNKDSGLLYHSVGKYGADYGSWMRSQEFQIDEGNCGDYWGVAGGAADIPAIKEGKNYTYRPEGKLISFREDSQIGRFCKKMSDAERPSGEWNTVDLYCYGDTSVHVMNGKVMMVLYRNKQIDDGNESPLRKGKIQIQSEGAEVYYKGIKIQQITSLPATLLK
ncbi:DUF1080 domain-containing protein [Pedobacter panaciterrae]|uniref:DUF1080 domain-containing protein n=1 Tax=Pedobacter panaciterrae TaxID=363849 RepID=A0ABU8NKT0_9SPHI